MIIMCSKCGGVLAYLSGGWLIRPVLTVQNGVPVLAWDRLDTSAAHTLFCSGCGRSRQWVTLDSPRTPVLSST